MRCKTLQEGYARLFVQAVASLTVAAAGRFFLFFCEVSIRCVELRSSVEACQNGGRLFRIPVTWVDAHIWTQQGTIIFTTYHMGFSGTACFAISSPELVTGSDRNAGEHLRMPYSGAKETTRGFPNSISSEPVPHVPQVM